jgi:hypothetical protein
MRKEHPISYTPEMIRARRAGRKSVTRRLILPQPEVFDNAGRPDFACLKDSKRNWQVGDLLWIKETWAKHKDFENEPVIGKGLIQYAADGKESRPVIRWRSGRLWVARSWDEIVSIKVEQLWDITEADAIREGIPDYPDFKGDSPRDDYIALWDSIYAKRGYPWDGNWWVWRIEFKEYLRQGSKNGIH